MKLDLKEDKRALTRGHKTLGAKWLFEPRFSHQGLLYLASEVAPNSPTFHTAIRWAQYKEDCINEQISYICRLNIN